MLAPGTDLRRYLSARERGMQQEEEENHDHCRLGDEIFLELERYPIEAVFTGQYRTHQQHVTEHEQRKQQPAAATGQLVNDLATGLCKA